MADSITADIQERIGLLLDDLDATDDPEERVKIMRELRQLWTVTLDRTDNGPTETRKLEGLDVVADFTDGE